MQKDWYRPKWLQVFLFCLKGNVSQTFISSSWKKVFPKCIHHWYNLLRRMFFIPFDNWKHYFLHKFIVILCLGATAMLLRFLKQVFSKKSAFYFRCLHNNITMNLIPKEKFKTKLLLLKFSPKEMICSWCFFYTLWFCECSTFFFKNGIFKTQAPWRHVFFIKSYNQVFMTCICSHKLFKWEVTSENINNTLCK